MHRIFSCLIILAIGLLIVPVVSAQVCTGSLGAPVVNYTFGAGTSYSPGPALPSGTTNLTYFNDNCGGPDGGIPGRGTEGVYTIQTEMGTACKGATWTSIAHDHTGDMFGYMMVINASLLPDVFFTTRIDGSKLCPDATYFFGAYVMNILKDLPSTKGYIEPNLTFIIEKPDGTVLKSIDTDPIKAVFDPQWKQYGALFTSPADGSDLIIKIRNKAPGGNGNDLAIDDITVSPCGPLIETGFNILGVSKLGDCAPANLNFTLVAKQTGYSNPHYKWQQKIGDGVWTDISLPGAATTNLPITMPNAGVLNYQYRIGVIDGTGTSENCRIYSDPIALNVYPVPVITLAKSTSACTGFPLQLSSYDTSTSTYEWSGPGGFTSAAANPTITLNTDKSYNGAVYTVKVTTDGCPAFANTTVTVYDKVIINNIKDVTICVGNSTQLSVVALNATRYKWTPSAGLDHDDIPNPVAKPANTTRYTVEVYNDGCPDVRPSLTSLVTVVKQAVVSAGKTVKVFEGQTAKLQGSAIGENISSTFWTPADYLDDPNSLTPITSATRDITYTLHAVSGTCGESTSNVFVRVYNKLNVFTSFTPNGDGINDVWNITNLSTYPNATLDVYDRQGQKVFQSKGGYANPWDGMFAGARLPVGTYYYIINLNENNLPRTSGWVFIVR